MKKNNVRLHFNLDMINLMGIRQFNIKFIFILLMLKKFIFFIAILALTSLASAMEDPKEVNLSGRSSAQKRKIIDAISNISSKAQKSSRSQMAHYYREKFSQHT